jgi:CubicO group peptidase (beta-lactamase class C family)
MSARPQRWWASLGARRTYEASNPKASAPCEKKSERGIGMSHVTLSDFVEATATKFGIPGVAVGVWADGQAAYACHGVTSVDNPLPVDKDTLYLLASVTKTYMATALMRLVGEGRVELDAPVRRYVPEFVLEDERFSALHHRNPGDLSRASQAEPG